MGVIGYNIVRFASSSGAAMAVEFDDFTLEAGIRPNINQARVSYLEAAKLGSDFLQTGSLQFFFSNDAAPDLTIANITIVDAQPAKLGQLSGGAGATVVEWRMSFADFRYGYAAPRGGRLRWGVVNPSNDQPPADYDTSSGQPPNGTQGQPLQMSDLIQKCLDAMGSSAAINGDPDNFDPPMDLQWHGSHAPTELEKLLDLCGMVYCPHLDGTDSIETIGQGNPPSIPAGQQIASVDCGRLDMRGKTCVVTSAPTPIIATETISDASDWTYVVQDYDKIWKSIHKSPQVMEGYTGVQLIQNNFQQLSTPNKTLESQLYYCIQLDPTKYPPALTPILSQRFDTNSGGGEDPGDDDDDQADTDNGAPPYIGRPQILANVAVLPQDVSGMPANGSNVDCNVTLKSEDTILVSDVRLGKMSGTPKTRNDYNKLFAELGAGDIQIRVSHEKLDSNFQPLYYVSVFTPDGSGGAVQSSSSNGNDVLTAPDAGTLFVMRPDFVLYEIDGTDFNQQDLDQKAQAIASDYLIDDSSQVTQTSGVGFITADLSGLISKIVYSQRKPQTDFYLNHWWRPSHRHFRKWQERLKRTHGVHEDYPQQHKQLHSRTKLGLSGATQPNVPHGSPAQDPENYQVLLGQIESDGGLDGTMITQATWTYTLLDMGGNPITDQNGNQIGKNLTPKKPRPAIGSIINSSKYGLYAWIPNGSGGTTLTLLDAFEGTQTGPCGS